MEEKVVVKRPPKSPFLAGALAFFFPFGIGQIYNRQILKGLIFLIVFAGLVTMQTTGEGQPFLGILLGGFYIYQIASTVDTFLEKKKWKKKKNSLNSSKQALFSGELF
jgi:TM2 domain-containing membrane protein YozV